MPCSGKEHRVGFEPPTFWLVQIESTIIHEFVHHCVPTHEMFVIIINACKTPSLFSCNLGLLSHEFACVPQRHINLLRRLSSSGGSRLGATGGGGGGVPDYFISKKNQVKKFHSLRSEFHSLLTPIEWKFTTQGVESRPVHSIFTPKEVITAVTTQGVTSVTNRVKMHSIFRELLVMYFIISRFVSECFKISLVCMREHEAVGDAALLAHNLCSPPPPPLEILDPPLSSRGCTFT